MKVAKHKSANTALSHKNPCFPCNTAVTNFLISHTHKVRFHDVIDRTVRIIRQTSGDGSHRIPRL